MPFNYQRKEHKRKRSNLDYHAIKSALDAIANGKSIRAAGIAHGIDTNTLRNYAVNKNKLKKLIELGGQHKSSQVFTVQEEIDLVEYLHSCRRMNNGLSRSEALTLACEFAKRNIKKIPESWLANNCAGVHWYRGFYKRHPELCLKSPEDAEASASAKIQKLLETCKETDSVELNIKQEHDFEVSIIETGATMVQEKIEKKNKAEQVCPNCHVVLPESFQATQFRHEQVRSVIAKVYHFLEREYDELKGSYPDTDWSALSDVRRRAAAATGVTEPLVRAILGEEADKRAAAKTAAAAKKPAPKRARTAKKKKKKLKRTSDTDDDDNYGNGNNDDDSAKQNEDLLPLSDIKPQITSTSVNIKPEPEEISNFTVPLTVSIKQEPSDELHSQDINVNNMVADDVSSDEILRRDKQKTISEQTGRTTEQYQTAEPSAANSSTIHSMELSEDPLMLLTQLKQEDLEENGISDPNPDCRSSLHHSPPRKKKKGRKKKQD